MLRIASDGHFVVTGCVPFPGALPEVAKSDCYVFMSFRLSGRTERLGCHWTDIHEVS